MAGVSVVVAGFGAVCVSVCACVMAAAIGRRVVAATVNIWSAAASGRRGLASLIGPTAFRLGERTLSGTRWPLDWTGPWDCARAGGKRTAGAIERRRVGNEGPARGVGRRMGWGRLRRGLWSTLRLRGRLLRDLWSTLRLRGHLLRDLWSTLRLRGHLLRELRPLPLAAGCAISKQRWLLREAVGRRVRAASSPRLRHLQLWTRLMRRLKMGLHRPLWGHLLVPWHLRSLLILIGRAHPPDRRTPGL